MTNALAEQIAQLLNEHNKLQKKYIGADVKSSSAKYYPYHYQGLLFGSVAVQRWNFMLSEVKHLVVHPAFRGFGLGKKMVIEALRAVDTPVVYATVREDNEPSIKLFMSLGFAPNHTADMGDHRIVLLLKSNEFYKPAKPDDKKAKHGGDLPGFFTVPRSQAKGV